MCNFCGVMFCRQKLLKNTTVWKPERLYSIRPGTLRKVMWSRLPGVASDHAEKQKKTEKVRSRPWAPLSAGKPPVDIAKC